MAKKKAFRRKGRQMKLNFDVPEEFDSEEEFMEAFMDRMDDVGWRFSVAPDPDEPGQFVDTHVTSIIMGDIEIAPEEEE